MEKGTFIIVILVILILTLASPIIFIWSLNTLFALNIAYGFLEWLAALILVGMVTGNGARLKSKD